MFNRKLRSLLNKTLREDAHYAQRNMAAFAAALRRECALGAHFLLDHRNVTAETVSYTHLTLPTICSV